MEDDLTWNLSIGFGHFCNVLYTNRPIFGPRTPGRQRYVSVASALNYLKWVYLQLTVGYTYLD